MHFHAECMLAEGLLVGWPNARISTAPVAPLHPVVDLILCGTSHDSQCSCRKRRASLRTSAARCTSGCRRRCRPTSRATRPPPCRPCAWRRLCPPVSAACRYDRVSTKQGRWWLSCGLSVLPCTALRSTPCLTGAGADVCEGCSGREVAAAAGQVRLLLLLDLESLSPSLPAPAATPAVRHHRSEQQPDARHVQRRCRRALVVVPKPLHSTAAGSRSRWRRTTPRRSRRPRATPCSATSGAPSRCAPALGPVSVQQSTPVVKTPRHGFSCRRAVAEHPLLYGLLCSQYPTELPSEAPDASEPCYVCNYGGTLCTCPQSTRRAGRAHPRQTP